MKIIGTGIDIVELSRIEKSAASEAFCRRVFTEAELAYADGRGKQRTASLAARWAGKEALLKSLGTGLVGAMSLTDIEILPDEKGAPVVTLQGAVQRQAQKLGVTEIKMTLSHGRDSAVSECVLWGEEVSFAAKEKFLGDTPDGETDCGGIYPAGTLITSDFAAGLLRERPVHCHKGSVGRVLVVAGSYGYTGAACLASLSALRVGAGLVTLTAAQSLAPILAVKCTEVMPKPVTESADCAGALGMKSYEEIMSLAETADTVLIGPGLGRQADTCALVQGLVVALGAEKRIQLVIDADGLFALRGMSGLLKKCVNPAVMTPHPGELAGLIGCDLAELQSADGSVEGLVRAARKKAGEWQAVIVAKSHRTVVAAPTGNVFVSTTGNPGMATAGCGDVLAGTIAGISREVHNKSEAGVDTGALAAAIVGVQLHGLAGDLAGEKFGNGLIASDIIRRLPESRRRLEKLAGLSSGREAQRAGENI